MNSWIRTAPAFALVSLALATGALTACSTDESTTTGSGGSGVTQNATVLLSEYKVSLDGVRLRPGTVQLTARNVGASTHEIVVVSAPDGLAALPRAADGTLDEDALAPGAMLGELEDIAPGQSKSAPFDLEPGRYVLLCNFTDPPTDTVPGAEPIHHLARGMALEAEVG